MKMTLINKIRFFFFKKRLKKAIKQADDLRLLTRRQYAVIQHGRAFLVVLHSQLPEIFKGRRINEYDKHIKYLTNGKNRIA